MSRPDPMPATAETDDLIAIDAPPVRLSFHWTGDRWAHRVEVGGRPVAASEEWGVDAGDPARVVSPAYQQVTLQPGAPGETLALAVGQWGKHHFSAVFAVSEGPGGVTVGVDVAVRTRGELQVVAATYRVDRGSGDLLNGGPEAVSWRADPGRLTFASAPPDGSVGLAEAGRVLTRVQAVRPAEPTSHTQRLVYRWAWDPTPAD